MTKLSNVYMIELLQEAYDDLEFLQNHPSGGLYVKDSLDNAQDKIQTVMSELRDAS